jgi:hypothetical protein
MSFILLNSYRRKTHILIDFNANVLIPFNNHMLFSQKQSEIRL